MFRPLIVRIAAVVVLMGVMVFALFQAFHKPAAPAVTTVNAVYWRDKAPLPLGLSSTDIPPEIKVLLTTKEWNPRFDYQQMHAFYRGAPHTFVLRAPGHQAVHLQLEDSTFSTDGRWQAYGAVMEEAERAKMARGVSYQLLAENDPHLLKWEVLQGTTLVKP